MTFQDFATKVNSSTAIADAFHRALAGKPSRVKSREQDARPVQTLPIGKLVVDTEYGAQRPPHSEKWFTDRSGRNFDPSLLHIVLVSKRKDGRYAILDGQNCVILAKRNGLTHIRCEVLDGLSPADESRQFIGRNDGKQIPNENKFAARVRRGEPGAVRLDRRLRAVGCCIGPDAAIPSKNIISSSVSIENIVSHEQLDQHLERALVLMNNEWPKHKKKGTTVTAICACLAAARGRIDEVGFRRVLRDHNPKILILKVAEEFGMAAQTKNVPLRMAAILLREYNHRRKHKRVDDVVTRLQALKTSDWLR